MRFTLKQLEAFVATVEHQGIAGAAEQLCVTKAAISQSLAELEKQCVSPIFSRQRQRLQLTPFGQMLWQQALPLLQHAADWQQLATGMVDARACLRIGASHTPGDYLLPQLLAQFRRDSGFNDQQLSLGNTAQVLQLLADSQLDVALVEGAVGSEYQWLQQEPWLSDEMLLVLPDSSPLADKTSLTWADLERQNWILREAGSGQRALIDQQLFSQLKHYRESACFSHTVAIIEAVRAHLGIACLPQLAVKACLSDPQLRVRSLPQPLVRQFTLLTHPSCFQSRQLLAWLDCCRQLVTTTATD